VGEEREPRRIYSPGDVAERLGVSDQRLRQLAAVFERVRGELPRDDRRARVWPEESVEELEKARAAVQERRATGVEAALRGEVAPVGVEAPKPPARTVTGDIAALAELVEELRGLREAVEEQNRLLRDQGERLEALERENRELRAALPAPVEAPEPAPEIPESATPTRAPETAPAASPLGRLERAVRRWWRGGGA
jgi:hypothetical protein